MGPQRKKSKPNNQADIDQLQNTQSERNQQGQSNQKTRQNPQPESDTQASSSSSNTLPEADTTSLKSNRRSSRSSWYNGGSWRAKATPVAQATRESISVAGGATSEALAESAGQVGRYMHNTLKRSSKSIPSLPSAARINATRSTATLENQVSKEASSSRYSLNTNLKESKDAAKSKEAVVDGQAETKDVDTVMEDAPQDSPQLPQDTPQADAPLACQDVSQPDPPLPPDPNTEQDTVDNNAANSAQKGWFGWWSRPDGYAGEAGKDTINPVADTEMAEATATPLPNTATSALTEAVEATNATTLQPVTAISTEDPAHSANDTATMTPDNRYGSTRSWFGLWSSAQNTQIRPDDASNHPAQPLPDSPVTAEATSPKQASPNSQSIPINAENTDKSKDANVANSPQQMANSPAPPKSSGWAFWARESTTDDAPATGGTERQVGELAVADTPSQSHPEAAQFNQERDPKTLPKKSPTNTSLKDKNGRVTAVASSVDSTTATPSDSPPQTRPQTPEPARKVDAAAKPAVTKVTKVPSHPPHMVMPTFRETYRLLETQTYWEKVTQYVASSLRLIDTPNPENHVYVTSTPPRIRKAVAVGIHGYFPAPLIQKVLGPPTGTSIRFAKHASAAVRAWADKNQPETTCDIETVALEGEGFIADRVSTLWKLLLNWLSHLRSADLIFVACHSQGVPVAVMLVSKLIQLGCLNPSARIGICAMAGVNLGPFADYKTRLLGAGSAAELFEFSRPSSKVSMEYASALDVVLRHNVRITYAGSIDDQLVSLEVCDYCLLI